MKIYFNTKTFERYYGELNITRDMAQAELLVMGAKKVAIEKFSNLKAVYRFGVGTDNIPFDYLRKKDIPVFFPSEKTKQILFESTANFTTYLIFHMHYSRCMGDTAKWEKHSRDYMGNKKLLVVGMGNIGKRVFEKMKRFTHATAFDIRTNQISEFKNLIGSADYISLHIPFTDDNRDFIDKEKLSWMKEDAVLVNTSRGALVNEESLYDRLMSTKMRAAFDVFWVEPYCGKLAELPTEKFLMTPHTASQTKEFVETSFSEILEIARKGEQR